MSRMPKDDLGLLDEIRRIFQRHRGRYGYRRVTLELKRNGFVVNHKRVQRMMVADNLRSTVRPKKYRSYVGEVGVAAPNLLDRKFTAPCADSKWLTDVTEFKVGQDKLYLSPILDVYNGEIVSYRIRRRPDLQLVTGMLDEALANRRTDGLLLHSDQGWHYRHPDYRSRLRGQGVTQSMSRRGNCLDNAQMESFFATLKSECFHGDTFKSVEDLEKTIHEYIDYYNNDRIQAKLKGLSPVEYRTQPFNKSALLN
jgi:transposase InsO family protein